MLMYGSSSSSADSNTRFNSSSSESLSDVSDVELQLLLLEAAAVSRLLPPQQAWAPPFSFASALTSFAAFSIPASSSAAAVLSSLVCLFAPLCSISLDKNKGLIKNSFVNEIKFSWRQIIYIDKRILES